MEPRSGGVASNVAVRESRLALGLSQEEFARRLGVSFATVNRWERGRNRPRGAAAAKLGSIRALVPSARQQPARLSDQPGLAASANSFVGRAREQAELARLVRESRLVTVTGPVGGGKTRLVSEAALAGDFGALGPVSMVTLASVTLDGDVAPEAARQLGVETDGDAVAALIEHGREARLLVLDNCEQVIAGCRALVERLLAGTSGLRIVATSREPLGLAGEAVLRLAPLDAGDPDSPAVALFVDRAGLRWPGYQPDFAELDLIARLCRRLDGLPLAIELAAGCLPELRPADIVARLDQRFELLVGSADGGAVRQRELRAAIGSSYDLLGDTERRVMHAASVFAKPFTLEALEAVAAGQGPDTLLVLGGLVGKSLVEVRPTESTMRYTLLESVRDYARERLAETGESDATWGRLAAWCRSWAQRAERGMAGRDQARWMAEAALDADSLAAAIEWAVAHGDGPLALDLGGSFWRFWYSRGDVGRGRHLLAAALELPGRSSPEVRRKALFGAGVLARHQGDFAAAIRYLRENLLLAETSGDQGSIAEAHNSLAGALHGNGDSRRAAQLLRRSLDYWEASGDRRGLAAALSNLGVLASDDGDQAAATDYGEQALALRLALGHAESIAISYENLATAALRAGSRADARRLFGETLRRYRQLAEPDGVATALEGLAGVVPPELGLTLLTVADRIRAEISVPRPAVAESFHAAQRSEIEVALGPSAAGRAREAADRMSLEAAVTAVEDELAQDPPLAPQRQLRRRLSRREREVLDLVAAGQTSKEIAAALGLSVRTVDRHLANIYAKIGARGRSEAIAFALRTAPWAAIVAS